MWPGNIETVSHEICRSLFINGLSAVEGIKKNNIKIIFQKYFLEFVKFKVEESFQSR